MQYSQILSMLNGLLLSTNVAALALTTADEFSVHSNEPFQWSYSHPNGSTKNIMDTIYLNTEQ